MTRADKEPSAAPAALRLNRLCEERGRRTALCSRSIAQAQALRLRLSHCDGTTHRHRIEDRGGQCREWVGVACRDRRRTVRTAFAWRPEIRRVRRGLARLHHGHAAVVIAAPATACRQVRLSRCGMGQQWCEQRQSEDRQQQHGEDTLHCLAIIIAQSWSRRVSRDDGAG